MSAPTVQLKVADIQTNGNVRRDLRLDDGFVQSIKEEGVIQPVLVTQDKDGVWHLIAGHRRLAGAIQAGRKTVPVHETVTDNITVTQVIENLHRNDLTPLELAQATWDLKVEGMTQADISTKVGMNTKVVSELQKIGKAVASDEFMDDERLDEMNQLTLEGLVDLVEYTPEDVHVADVIRIYNEEDNTSVRSAVSSAKHDAELAVFYTEIAADMHAWNEAGIQTVAGDPTIIKGETDQWGNAKHDRKFDMVGRNGVNVDLDKHMKLECHIIQIDDGNTKYGYGSKPRVIHWCSNPKIHAFKGKSEVKVIKAEDEHVRKSKALEDSRAIRADKLHRRQQALVYLTAREAKARTLDLALEVANDSMSWDDKKLACQILEIDGERPVPTDSNWYSKRYNDYLKEKFGKDYRTDDKSRLFQFRMIMAIKHWQDRAWASQPIVKAAVAEIGTLEVPVTE